MTLNKGNLKRAGLAVLSCLLAPTMILAQELPPADNPLPQPLPQILTPITNILTGLPNLLTRARDLKLLVLSADGTEPSLAAIKAILGQLGTPYDLVILTQTGGKLPKLEDWSKGYYQGIILATGNLATCTTNPCSLALPPEGWLTLDKYAVSYGVRILSYYTFPDPRYGISWTGGVASSGMAQFLPAATSVFPDLKRTQPVPVNYSYMYFAAPTPAAGESTTPFLTVDGQIAGVLHKKVDKREYLALTLDHNPNLLHSIVFGYGLVNWVTKGLFIGKRQAFFSPQIDDVFIGSDLFDATKAECRPTGFIADPTVDPSGVCPFLRITGADLDGIAAWQDQMNSGQSGNIKVNMAFNGIGTTAAGGALPGDTLTASARIHRSKFFWITHTYDHENLDCFNPAPNSGVCTPATNAQSLAEINQNITVAQNLGLVHDTTGMVTPNLSGLNNPAFLSAAASKGIRNLVMDTSLNPNVPFNAGVRSTHQSSILLIPRRPTNIFYNTSTGFNFLAGSQPDEYNYFYGPNGISRIGGPGGPPFFTTDQTHAQIINTESEAIIKNMLRGEIYPVMFHQANLWRYDGTNSLFTDVAGAVLSKFRAMTNLPVRSLSLTATGQAVTERMSFNASGVSATLAPGLSLTIKVNRSAKIPITGLCRSACEDNGGQPISHFSANPLLPTIVLLPQL
jgi:hypothetical protein